MNDYTPPGGPPQGPGPSREIFAYMGEENILRMIQDFYLELEKSPIRHIFSEDLKTAAERSGLFFIQVLGGPPRYLEAFGPPRMRQRHLPFKIDSRSREIWLQCFLKVLEDAAEKYSFPGEFLPGFIHWLDEFSLWMINSQD